MSKQIDEPGKVRARGGGEGGSGGDDDDKGGKKIMKN